MRAIYGHFSRDRRGNTAILLGLSLLPTIFLCGAALDYSGANSLRSALQVATDGVTIGLCKTPLTTTPVQMQNQAQSNVAPYLPKYAITVDPLAIAPGTPRVITMTSHVTATTIFGRITGKQTIPLSATASCATPVPRTFEIALVLDNTGSMANSGGAGTKMQAAQLSATNFVNYVAGNPVFSSSTRISVVPFAGAVAVDPSAFRYATWIDQSAKSAYHWRNFAGATAAGFSNRFDVLDKLKSAYAGWGWKGCFEALPYPVNVRDGAPSQGSPDSYFVPSVAPDEPGQGVSYGAYDSWGQGNFNSYLDDRTAEALCSSQPASETDALGRACKYRSPTNAAPSTNSGAGIPNGPNFVCTSAPLARLTTDFNAIKSRIAAMSPMGQTNIHDGLMWGWRTLSPLSVFADGTGYGSTGVTKVLVLMTDGTNTVTANPYNGVLGSLYSQFGYFKNADGSTPAPFFSATTPAMNSAGTARNAIDAITLEACNNAKAAGVTVYTIGFSVASDPIDQQGVQLLASCAGPSAVDASPPSGPYAYISNDSNSLVGAFAAIGSSIGALRLTR